MKYLTYLIYILIFETFTLGGSIYLVAFQHRSWLWLILGIYLSASAYSPERWGKIYK